MIRSLWALLLISAASGADAELTLKVVVTGVRSSKGSVEALLYSSKEGFPRNPDKATARRRAAIEGRGATLVFDGVRPGTYAILVAHDENENGKLDTNFLGMPKEGVGLSNNPKLSGPPAFQDAKFEVKVSQTLNVVVSY